MFSKEDLLHYLKSVLKLPVDKKKALEKFMALMMVKNENLIKILDNDQLNLNQQANQIFDIMYQLMDVSLLESAGDLNFNKKLRQIHDNYVNDNTNISPIEYIVGLFGLCNLNPNISSDNIPAAKDVTEHLQATLQQNKSVVLAINQTTVPKVMKLHDLQNKAEEIKILSKDEENLLLLIRNSAQHTSPIDYISNVFLNMLQVDVQDNGKKLIAVYFGISLDAKQLDDITKFIEHEQGLATLKYNGANNSIDQQNQAILDFLNTLNDKLVTKLPEDISEYLKEMAFNFICFNGYYKDQKPKVSLSESLKLMTETLVQSQKISSQISSFLKFSSSFFKDAAHSVEALFSTFINNDLKVSKKFKKEFEQAEKTSISLKLNDIFTNSTKDRQALNASSELLVQALNKGYKPDKALLDELSNTTIRVANAMTEDYVPKSLEYQETWKQIKNGFNAQQKESEALPALLNKKPEAINQNNSLPPKAKKVLIAGAIILGIAAALGTIALLCKFTKPGQKLMAKLPSFLANSAQTIDKKSFVAKAARRLTSAVSKTKNH